MIKIVGRKEHTKIGSDNYIKNMENIIELIGELISFELNAEIQVFRDYIILKSDFNNENIEYFSKHYTIQVLESNKSVRIFKHLYLY